MPTEPPPTSWSFPEAGDDDLVAAGADLEPGTILAAYRVGMFPMPIRRGVPGWWSPDPRGILPLDGLVVTRSLRRSVRRFDVRIDAAFEAVIDACGDERRPGRWIDADIRAAYVTLHHLGWAHSVETYDRETGELVGGLYGLAVGGLFAGESMFHRRTDASKAALVALVDHLSDGAGDRLLDVQWVTEHLATLGAVAVPRGEYLRRLESALALPLPAAFER